MNKLEECARAAHEEYLFQIRDRATKKDGWENVARAVIRCLMNPSEAMRMAYVDTIEDNATAVICAVLQAVLDGKE